jgi:hypothetical protein
MMRSPISSVKFEIIKGIDAPLTHIDPKSLGAFSI